MMSKVRWTGKHIYSRGKIFSIQVGMMSWGTCLGRARLYVSSACDEWAEIFTANIQGGEAEPSWALAVMAQRRNCGH
jgi:hypothetical protein